MVSMAWKKSEPMWSNLLMKAMRGTLYGGLTPNGLGLRLDAGDGVEDGNGTSRTRRQRLTSAEVNVARGVDDLDDVVLPEARGGSGGNGNAALLLLNHPVHGGGAIVDLTDLVGLAGVVAMRSVWSSLPASM